MKKLFMVLAVMTVFSASAYAQTVDISGDVSNGKTVEVTGLEDGFYDLTATCKNTAVSADTYLYGESAGYTKASTVLPLSQDGVTVTVKGIGVSGGKCEIGVMTDGNSVIEISDVNLEKSEEFNFITGGDMTEVNYIESLGGEYKDSDGNKVDVFEYLADNGVNMARIRLSNTTGKGTGDGTYYLPGGFQDEEDCLKLAKRAKDAGMGIQFTFNYSDYWSNGTRQIIPSEWAAQIKEELGYDVKDPEFLNSMTDTQKKEIQDKLVTIIYDYTYDIMSKLKAQDTVPEYVSLGNEINGGLLFPFGNAYSANMNKDRFELVFDNDKSEDDIICGNEITYMMKFLKSGYDAVKAVSPETQVIVHFATDGENGSIKDSRYTWLMDEVVKAGAVDVLGASYYPAWSNSTASAAADFCERMYEKYGKPVMIMETGYNWNPTRKDGYPGQLVDIDAYKDIYPPSQDGHAGYMAELFNELKGAGGSCVGVLYWDPCMIHVENPEKENASLSGWAIRESDDKNDANVVENTTLFDFDGKAIKSVGVFKNSMNSEKKNGLSGNVTTDGNKVSATVTNNSSSEKKANLYLAVYDDEGVLKNVKIDSKSVQAGGSVDLSIDGDLSGIYKTFLWNGENFAPIN